MLWHIVKFRFREDVSREDRAGFETDLRNLAKLAEDVAVLRVSHSIDEPDVTGLITAFADAEALERYRIHPDHVPVVERAKQLCAEVVRLDVVTNDPPDALSRT